MNKALIEKLLEMYLVGQTEQTPQTPQQVSNNPFLGKYVIVRGYDAGVRCGKLVDATPGNIILEDARNLWRRRCKEGVGLSGLASHGLADRSEVKVLETQGKVLITDARVSTFFEVSTEVEKQLRDHKTAVQS